MGAAALGRSPHWTSVPAALQPGFHSVGVCLLRGIAPPSPDGTGKMGEVRFVLLLLTAVHPGFHSVGVCL